MKIRFVSRNDSKIREVQSLLDGIGIEIVAARHAIDEIQTEDVNKLVRDKLMKAFRFIGRPVFVEHTGLYIESLNAFPGGLTQLFWDKLQAEKFSALFGCGADTSLIARTTIGYCDSQKIHFFEGSISGKIASEPRGNRDFQWDCVFIPDGHTKTFAEMGADKDKISMRKIAFDKFKSFLAEGNK